MSSIEASVIREAIAKISRPKGWIKWGGRTWQNRKGYDYQGFCAIGSLSQSLSEVAPEMRSDYEARYEILNTIRGRMERIIREQYPKGVTSRAGHLPAQATHIENFNDARGVGKQDVIRIMEKTAIEFEEYVDGD